LIADRLEQFRRGLEVELKHGAIDPETNVTGDDLVLTGIIALVHLKEIRDYYTRLDHVDAEAGAQLNTNYLIQRSSSSRSMSNQR
jgi:hypothetical protein